MCRRFDSGPTHLKTLLRRQEGSFFASGRPESRGRIPWRGRLARARTSRGRGHGENPQHRHAIFHRAAKLSQSRIRFPTVLAFGPALGNLLARFMRLQLAESDEQIAACFPVLVQLRPHLDVESFLPRIRRQQQQGFRLACLEDAGQVVAVAGFRVMENLAWGRFLYVDDLVTDAAQRSRGHGARLLEWLLDLARNEGCQELHLDSGVQRFDAHRFYLLKRMRITAHHFALELPR